MHPILKQIFPIKKPSRGQSFVELALVVPILLLILLGLVEVAFFIGRYLDVLDLSREAARFASVRDPFTTGGDLNCSSSADLNFYYDTSCVLSPPSGSVNCPDPAFCNGFTPYMTLNLDTDDVVISVFTIAGHAVTNRWPQPNTYWALSNVDFANNVDLNLNGDPGHPNNFLKDCQGNTVRTQPYYTQSQIESMLLSDSPGNKGYITVEIYYCYNQVLGLPLLTDIVPDPLQIRAYTLMPLPAGQPTPTAIP